MEVPQTSPSGSKVVWITKFFWNLLSEVGLNFLCNVFLHTLSSWFEGSDPPPLSWACIAVFATAIFQVRKFQGISNLKFQGISNSKFQGIRNSEKMVIELFPQETSCRTGIGEEKEDGMEDFYVCQIKIPPQGWPSHNILHDFQHTDQDMWECFDQLSI